MSISRKKLNQLNKDQLVNMILEKSDSCDASESKILAVENRIIAAINTCKDDMKGDIEAMRDAITTNLMKMIDNLNVTVKGLKSNVTELNRDVAELCRDNDEFAERIDQLERQGNAT